MTKFNASVLTGLKGACALSAILIGTSAWAQDPASVDDADEDIIIVQALKQGQSLLDTAASVQVVGQSELVTANVSSARDLSGVVPGFTFMQGVASGSASFRGLGSNSSDPAIESSVGGFNDGIYLGHGRDFTTPLYDVQQVEFIAGTQSTVLGKNTSLGAINITSRRPGRDLAFEGSAAYTSEIDGVTVRAGADLPLGENFAVRVAGFFNDEAGFVRNDFLGRDEQQLQDVSGRVVVDEDISSASRLTMIYQHDRRRAAGQNMELLNDPDGLAEFIALGVLGVPDFEATPDDRNLNGSDRLIPGAPAVDLPFDHQDTDRATAIFETETSGGLTLTAQTGFMTWDSARRLDLDFTSVEALDLLDDESSKVFSQELRMASPKSNALSYVVGLYYYHNNYSLRRRVESDLGVDLDSNTKIVTDSFSAFASARYDISDSFAVQAGLRHTWEGKGVTYDVSGALAAPIPFVKLPTKGHSETDYNFGVEYRPSSELMLYATYARGSKNGGFQSSPDSIALASYGAEVAKSFEVGAKLNLGSRGSLTFAAFDTRVIDFQASRLVAPPGGGLPQLQISNVDSRTTGAEFKGQWSPTDNLRLSGALTYADSRFTEGLDSEVEEGVFVPEITKGMRLPRAPKWQGQVGIDYSIPLSESVEFSASGRVRYASTADLQFSVSNPFAPKAVEHATADLELKLAGRENKWSVALIGNNLTDVRYAVFASDYLLSGLVDPTATPAYYGTRNRPRTFTVRAGLSF